MLNFIVFELPCSWECLSRGSPQSTHTYTLTHKELDLATNLEMASVKYMIVTLSQAAARSYIVPRTHSRDSPYPYRLSMGIGYHDGQVA